MSVIIKMEIMSRVEICQPKQLDTHLPKEHEYLVKIGGISSHAHCIYLRRKSLTEDTRSMKILEGKDIIEILKIK